MISCHSDIIVYTMTASHKSYIRYHACQRYHNSSGMIYQNMKSYLCGNSVVADCQPQCPAAARIMIGNLCYIKTIIFSCMYGFKQYKSIACSKGQKLEIAWGPWQFQASSLGCLGGSLTRHAGQWQNLKKWKWQNLRRNPACLSSPLTPGAISWILILKYNIARVNVKYLCENRNLFQNCFEIRGARLPVTALLQAGDGSICGVTLHLLCAKA